MKKWNVLARLKNKNSGSIHEDIVLLLLNNRAIRTMKDKEEFLHPREVHKLTYTDVGVEAGPLTKAVARIKKAIAEKESIVVYADYDADGITAGAIMWETLYGLGARVMPYIPHRQDEGYGLSKQGIDNVRSQFDPSLIITVDHGITAWEKVAYAKKQGIDVIVTDHHVAPQKLPDCTIVHTIKLSGSGVSLFVAKEFLKKPSDDLVALAAIGTIADLVPLVGPNRAIAAHGLSFLNRTKRVGLDALMAEGGLTKGELRTYDVSHVLAPRLNAMGRLEHALDALRLLCTKDAAKAHLLAQKLGMTNRDRQQLTIQTTQHALALSRESAGKKLIFVSHESYNQGIIGLVAGKLVDEYYRPAIVVSQGAQISKASARSIAGFNIVEAIRRCSDILIDVGGHPMAAGFTVQTQYLATLQSRLEDFAQKEINEDALTRVLTIDMELPLSAVSYNVWRALQNFAPFGFGNPEPVFASRQAVIRDTKRVGKDGKHVKLRVSHLASDDTFDAIAFNFGSIYGQLQPGTPIDIAYTIDMDTWSGNKKLQLKVRDIRIA